MNDCEKVPHCAIYKMRNTTINESSDYFKLSKKQAKLSFYISILISIIGFAFIVYAVYYVLKINSESLVTILSTIGGIMSEFISLTLLWIYKKTMEQLNFYYNRLNKNEYFLSSIQLVSRLDKDRQNAMYEEIIKAEIELFKSM